jgi:hypothetical protein
VIQTRRINPVGMSAADESRIVLLELLMHENDATIVGKIREEEIFFRDKAPGWCSYMISLAHMIPPAIEVLEGVFPSSDRRHRQNMATLVAGAFVALNGRAPTAEEADNLTSEFAGTVEIHAEALDRDDAEECLDHLFSYVVEKYPLGHWLGYAHQHDDPADFHLIDVRRIIQMHGMVLRLGGNEPGLFLRNGSPAIDKVFQNTRWADRGWMRALHKLEGSFTPKNPVYFGHLGRRGEKARAIGLPLEGSRASTTSLAVAATSTD